MDRTAASSQAGFVLLEAVVAVAIVTICAGAVLAAVCAVERAAAGATARATLSVAAHNILTDLRAATAYDGAHLAPPANAAAAFDLSEPVAGAAALRVHVVVSIDRPDAAAAARATISVSDGTGNAATVAGTLAEQAPRPGSLVPASTTCDDAEHCGPGVQLTR